MILKERVHIQQGTETHMYFVSNKVESNIITIYLYEVI